MRGRRVCGVLAPLLDVPRLIPRTGAPMVHRPPVIVFFTALLSLYLFNKAQTKKIPKRRKS